MGDVSAITNTGKTLSEYQDILRWMTSAELSQDGAFTRIDNRGKKTEQEGLLKWVEGVSLSQDGTLTKHFNNINFSDEVQFEKLKWPVNISLNQENGVVTTTFNDGSVNTTQNPQMDWIKTAKLSEDKQLQIDYVNAEDISVNLKTPNKLALDESNGDFYVEYNTGEKVVIGNIGEQYTISAIAADTEKDTSSLKTGGLWLVTQDAFTPEESE